MLDLPRASAIPFSIGKRHITYMKNGGSLEIIIREE